jgi:MFS family permease
MENHPSLLQSRRFIPLFFTQFLGAFNDNVFKNALVILITFQSAIRQNETTLVALSGVLFILPFFLFSAMAGQIADKFERSRLIKIVKLAEIVIMGLAALGFYLDNLPMLMTVLFLMGAQSSFFGPLKYSVIPQLMKEEELLFANGLVSMSTFISILIGTLTGGLIIALEPYGREYLSLTVLGVALAGWLASRNIPLAPPPDPQLRIMLNPFRETWRIIHFATEQRLVFISIIGISWFWAIGATYLSVLPSFSKHTLHGDPHIVTYFLTMFSIGIGTGSLLCHRLAASSSGIGLVIPGSLGISLFSALLFVLSHTLTISNASILSSGMLILGANILAIGLSGGLYIVPLIVIMQSRSNEQHRSRIIGANNIFNALFMLGSGTLIIILIQSGLTETQFFMLIGISNLIVIRTLACFLPDLMRGTRTLLQKNP